MTCMRWATGLSVWLVDARQMKYVPGRKSDVLDCQWLQKLMSLRLLRAAWRPGDEVCVVRAVVRQREVLQYSGPLLPSSLGPRSNFLVHQTRYTRGVESGNSMKAFAPRVFCLRGFLVESTFAK